MHPLRPQRGRGTPLALLLVASLCGGLAWSAPSAGPGKPALGLDPRNATYRVEGREIRLCEGLAEAPAAPGSAALERTSVFGEPAAGDLDGDGSDDAAMFLVHQPGGSGTFYYVAAALRPGGNFRGTNAELLGDRVLPDSVSVRNGLVIAGYLDRRPGEPMAAPPTVARTRYLVLRGDELRAVPDVGPEGAVLEGWLRVGHEVRSFEPCGGKRSLWISGGSAALAELRAAYRRALPDAEPHGPLFAAVAGREDPRPTDGFGADYDGSFLVSQLVQVWPKGNCRGEYLVLDQPAAGQVVRSPLAIRGRARGSWFFEGDFPMELRDARGEVLARHFATAQGEWMTKDFVPFEGRLEFPRPEQPQSGTLVLRKDNPSEDRALDDAVEIPIRFR